MIVVDASAAVSALLNDGLSRAEFGNQPVSAPHHIDVEIASALRNKLARQELSVDQAKRALITWQCLGVGRYPMNGLLGRIWELRDNLTTYDASYVALAEALECALLTGDERISRTPGMRIPITVVPN